MNNKYYIVNSNEPKFCIDYLFYIIILIFVIYLIINFNNNYEKENFEEDNGINLLNKDELYKQCSLSNDFILKKNKELENKINEQNRAIFINKHYNKIDENNFNNELFYKYFENVSFPQINLNNKVLINSVEDLNKIKDDMRNYKNIYKVGDIVNQPSTENISSDDICYKDYDMNILDNQNLKKNYTNCMVCSINSPENYKNDISWEKTKTNIKDICLYNINSEDNSLIPNYNKCKQLCKK
jgi:hypothetical protein